MKACPNVPYILPHYRSRNSRTNWHGVKPQKVKPMSSEFSFADWHVLQTNSVLNILYRSAQICSVSEEDLHLRRCCLSKDRQMSPTESPWRSWWEKRGLPRVEGLAWVLWLAACSSHLRLTKNLQWHANSFLGRHKAQQSWHWCHYLHTG